MRPPAARRCRSTHRWGTAPFPSRSPPSARESEALPRDEKTKRRRSLESSLLLLLPPHAPRTGAAAGSAGPRRPLTRQSLPTDPTPPLQRLGAQQARSAAPCSAAFSRDRARTNHPLPGPRRLRPPHPLAGLRCTAYSSRRPASPPSARPGRVGQRAVRLSESWGVGDGCRDVGSPLVWAISGVSAECRPPPCRRRGGMTRQQRDPGAAPQASLWLWVAPACCTEAPQAPDGRFSAAGPGQLCLHLTAALRSLRFKLRIYF